MSSSDSPRRFLAGFAGALLALLASLFAITALVDARGLVAQVLPDAPRLCSRGIMGGDRAAKRILPQAQPATEALLGNSRVAWGFAAEDVRALLPGPAINLGIEAATLQEMAEHFDELVRRGEVRRVWIALDYGMFEDTVARREPAAGALSPPLYALRHGIADFAAIRQALRTLANGYCSPPRMNLRGFLEETRADRIEPTGLDRAALARAILTTTEMLRVSRGHDPVAREHRYRDHLARIAALADEARRRNIALVLYVPPSHPNYFEAMRRAGSASGYRRWQADLARLFADRPGIVLRDFTSASAELTRAGRCAAEGSSGCPFYDPVHFRPFVGAMILRSGTEGCGFVAARGPGERRGDALYCAGSSGPPMP